MYKISEEINIDLNQLSSIYHYIFLSDVWNPVINYHFPNKLE